MRKPNEDLSWNGSTRSLLSDRRNRARRRRQSYRMALLGRPGPGLEARWRAGSNRDGLRPKLPARSAALGLATPDILDPVADDDVLRGQGRGPEHAVRNPRQRIDAVSLRRYRSRRLSDARLALVHRAPDPQLARRAHARRRRSPGAAISPVRNRPRREARYG